MFVRRIAVWQVDVEGHRKPCPLNWIDNFAMRNFTNDAVFDDTLPVADGVLEIGARVPLARLQAKLDDWFRRKSWLKAWERVELEELTAGAASSDSMDSAKH
jgi:hypothetical protein